MKISYNKITKPYLAISFYYKKANFIKGMQEKVNNMKLTHHVNKEEK